MPDTYTVRLDDGSEIGPLDLPAVREWYARGLIHADSPVLSPGSQRWVALRQVRGLPATAATAPRPAPRPSVRPAPRPAPRVAAPAESARSAPVSRRTAWLALAGVVVLGGLAVTFGVRRSGSAASTPTPASAELAHEALARFSAQRRAEAVRLALEAVPHLTPRAAEALMSRSQAEVLSPEETFRRSQAALRRALSALSSAETRELARLNDALHARLNARDRRRLGDYQARIKESLGTSPAEDRALALVMRTAELKLPPAQLARLRALYEKATLLAP